MIRWLSSALALAIVLVGGCGEDPSQRERALARIDAHVAAGEIDQALAGARAIQSAWPDEREGWLIEALIQYDRWEVEHAAIAFERAYQLQPEGFPYLTELVYTMGFAKRARPDARTRLLDTHAERFPADARYVAEARLVQLTTWLNQSPARRTPESLQELAALLDAFEAARGETSGEHYRAAEALVLLGRWDEAIDAMRAGVGADTERWDALTLQMGLAFLQIHRGEADRAWAGMGAYLARYADWPGYHFAMRMPMAEFLQLTAVARYGRPLPSPPALAGRPQAAAAAGVQTHLGVEDTRSTIAALLAALDAGDDAAATERLIDLEILVRRDRGCVTETEIVRPHLMSLVHALRGDIAARAGDAAGAAERYGAALALYPEDAWLAEKLVTAQIGQDPPG